MAAQPSLVHKLPTLQNWLHQSQGTPLPGRSTTPVATNPAPTPSPAVNAILDQANQLLVEPKAPTTAQTHRPESAPATVAEMPIQAPVEATPVIEQAPPEEAPLTEYLTHAQEDEPSLEQNPENEGVSAYLQEVKDETPAEELQDLVAEAESQTGEEVKVVFMPSTQQEHDEGKKMGVTKGGHWLYQLVEKLKDMLKERGLLAAFKRASEPVQ